MVRIVLRDQNEQCTTNKMRSAFAVIFGHITKKKNDADARRVRMWYLDFRMLFVALYFRFIFCVRFRDVEAQNF